MVWEILQYGPIASALTLYLFVRLSNSSRKGAEWWLAGPFVLIFLAAPASYMQGKASLGQCIFLALLCILIALVVVDLCRLVNSLRLDREFDPAKPIFLPLPR